MPREILISFISDTWDGSWTNIHSMRNANTVANLCQWVHSWLRLTISLTAIAALAGRQPEGQVTDRRVCLLAEPGCNDQKYEHRGRQVYGRWAYWHRQTEQHPHRTQGSIMALRLPLRPGPRPAKAELYRPLTNRTLICDGCHDVWNEFRKMIESGLEIPLSPPGEGKNVQQSILPTKPTTADSSAASVEPLADDLFRGISIFQLLQGFGSVLLLESTASFSSAWTGETED